MRAEFVVGRLRAFWDAMVPNARAPSFLVGCFFVLPTQVSLAQTSGINLVVNGLTNSSFTQSDVSSNLCSGELADTAKVNSLGVTVPNSNSASWRRRVRVADPPQPIPTDLTPEPLKIKKNYAKEH